MAKYIKKPVEIEAFQLTFEMAQGKQPVPEWFVKAVDSGQVEVIYTGKIHGSQYCDIFYEDKMILIASTSTDDYIVCDENGIIFALSKDIFEKTYEKVEE